MIIVEGMDNSGKTTLIRNLRRRFPLLTEGKSPDNPGERFKWWMKELNICLKDKSRIYDRFVISEYVYGPIIRGDICMGPNQEMLAWSFLTHIKPLIILCASSQNGIESRVHMEGVVENYDVLAKRYETVVPALLTIRGLEWIDYNFAKRGAFQTIERAVAMHLWSNGK